MPHPTQKRRKPRPDRSPTKPAQPSADEQSGSTGRRTPDSAESQGANTGQDRYGQSGFPGGPRKIDRTTQDADPREEHRSNPGSGHAEADETKHRQDTDADAADIPKTG